MAFAGRPEGGAGGLSRRQSDRCSGGARQGEPRRARRISRAGGGLHGLPHRARRQGLCRRPRLQAAVRHAVLDQHHARQGDRHRQLQRSGFPQRGASRRPPRRRAALSGDAVYLLHLHDRCGRAGDQGLSVQPAAGARGRARQYADVSVQPALGDGLLVGAVQSGHALRARHLEEPGMEQGRLSRRGAGALRRMPHAAQSGVRARQPQEIRRRGDGGLARLQHHVRTRPPASAPGATRIWSPICRPDMRRVTAPPRGRWAKRSTTASASWRPKTSAPWWPICAACRRSPRPICRRRWRRRRRLRTRMAAARRIRAARWCSKAPASVATAGPARVRSRPSPR